MGSMMKIPIVVAFESACENFFRLYQSPVPTSGPEFNTPTKFEKHYFDFIIIFFGTLFFIWLRLSFESIFGLPLAQSFKIYTPTQKRVIPVTAYKFCEQLWFFLNHSFSLLFGTYLILQQPYVDNILSLTVYNTPKDGLRHLWYGYSHEHKLLPASFKVYYLWEICYWLHLACTEFYFYFQAKQWVAYQSARKSAVHGGSKVVVKKPPAGRRKVKSDAMQLLAHHIVTVLLVAGSYYVNLNRMGHLTLALFDVSDVILSFAKVLKYIPKMPSIITDTLFVIFMLSWLWTRHLYFMLRIMPSVYWDSLTYIQDKKFSGFTTGHFYSYNVHRIFIGLFVVLELLMCFWFYLILKVVVKVVVGSGADDVRSDNEEDSEDEKLEKKE